MDLGAQGHAEPFFVHIGKTGNLYHEKSIYKDYVDHH
jgi:hypothetical protein